MPDRALARFALTGCALFLLFATPAIAEQEAEKKAVLGTVQTLLDGWREADAAKLEASLHQDFREVTLHLQDGAWTFAVVNRDSLIESMAQISKGAWDDQLMDPQVHVDGPIAVVWSRYRFTVRYEENGVVHAPVHCGIETFQLYLTDAGWKIVNFADTHSDRCS